jgi:uncharacterized protein YndB with AHSA1/START domain
VTDHPQAQIEADADVPIIRIVATSPPPLRSSTGPKPFDGWPDGVSLETLTFTDLGDGRTRLTAQSLVDSFASHDQWLASGMDVGINDGYAKLDTLLTEI